MHCLEVAFPAFSSSTDATKVGVPFLGPIKTTGTNLGSEAPTGDAAGLGCVFSALALDWGGYL